MTAPSRSLTSLVVSALVISVTAGNRAEAAPHPAPLTLLPAERLQSLAPMLRSADLALIESEHGGLKQLTTMTLAAAPPEVVRDVVIHPERYGDFVRNMKSSTVHVDADGAMVHEYAISYTVYRVDGRHKYRLNPPDSSSTAASVEMFDPDDNGTRHYRWEFLPVGGGTLVVLYGNTKIPHDGFIERFLKRAPTLEVGLALIPQMTLLLAMRDRAQQISGGRPLPPRGESDYGFLLERGTVGVVRTTGGRISDLSLVTRTTARLASLIKVAADPTQWSRFIPTFDRSTPTKPVDGLPTAELEQSLPLMSWTTTYGYRAEAASVDLFGLSGDLRGGRIRIDVRPVDEGHSELVLRMNQHFDQGSVVVRQLYKLEPLFEDGVNVGLGLLPLEGLRGRAEELSQARGAR